jgi:hypothetical protein
MYNKLQKMQKDSDHGLTEGNNRTFAWKDGGKAPKATVTISGAAAEIRTGHIPSTLHNEPTCSFLLY